MISCLLVKAGFLLAIRKMQIELLRGSSSLSQNGHKNRDSKCWQGCGKEEALITVGGSANDYSHYGINKGVPPKSKTTTWPSCTIPGYIYSENWVSYQKDTCTCKLIAAVFTRARRWTNLDAHPQMGNENWYVYSMEFYSTVKIKKKSRKTGGSRKHILS